MEGEEGGTEGEENMEWCKEKADGYDEDMMSFLAATEKG